MIRSLNKQVSSLDREDLIAGVGRLVMQFQDATQRFDEEVGARYGLSAAERHCLSLLWQGPQTASAIARKVRLTPAAVTALVDRLARRGYVRRESDPADRRKVMVVTTEKAAQLVARTYAPVGEAGAKMLSEFSKAELEIFARMLERSITLQEEMTDQLMARAEDGEDG
jgi:DNA-binding MarR family transcriptional regulator